MAENKNYYEILGINRYAKPAEIRSSFLDKAKQTHPDKPQGNAAEFRLILEAYETLYNETSRAQYNKQYDKEIANDRIKRKYNESEPQKGASIDKIF